MVFATLAFLGAFGADQGLLTYFADLSGAGLPYQIHKFELLDCWESICNFGHICNITTLLGIVQ